MSPAIAAVYHATINNYHLPNANYLQPSYQQSYISHLSNNSNHLHAGHTTYQEYRGIFEKDRALARRFQKIDVGEPTEDEAVKILQGLKSRFGHCK